MSDVRRATLDRGAILIPTDDAGLSSPVTVKIIEASKGRDSGPPHDCEEPHLDMTVGPLSKDGYKTFHALFTEEDVGFNIRVENKSDTWIR